MSQFFWITSIFSDAVYSIIWKISSKNYGNSVCYSPNEFNSLSFFNVLNRASVVLFMDPFKKVRYHNVPLPSSSESNDFRDKIPFIPQINSFSSTWIIFWIICNLNLLSILKRVRSKQEFNGFPLNNIIQLVTKNKFFMLLFIDTSIIMFIFPLFLRCFYVFSQKTIQLFKAPC